MSIAQRERQLTLSIIDEMASANKKEFFLNFQNSQHLDYFFSLFGGQDYARENFPILYNSVLELENIVSKNYIKSNAAKINLQKLQNLLSNKFIVNYLVYSNSTQKLTINIIGYFPQYTSGVGVIKIIDKDSGANVVEPKSIGCAGKKLINATLSWENIDLRKYKNNTFIVNFIPAFSLYVNLSLLGNPLAAIPKIFSRSVSVAELTDNIIKKIDVSAPALCDSTMNLVHVVEQLRVSGYNDLGSKKPYRYTDIYKFESLRGEESNLFLDFTGNAEFNNSDMEFKGALKDDVNLSVFSNDSLVEYNTQYLDFLVKSFEKTPTGFKWDLKRGSADRETHLKNVNWHSKLDASMYGKPEIHFNFNMHFSYGTKGSNSNNKRGFLVLSSTLEKDETYMKKMPKLKFFAGCLTGDTLILMADGCEKPIANIRIGEYVCGECGNKVRVVNITKGIEIDPVYCIRVDGSKRLLKMSKDHVLKTARGLLPAKELNGADQIETINHSYAPIRELFLADEKEVYNLELENSENSNGMLMVAEGLLVGDSVMQNKNDYQPEPVEVDQGVLAEIQKIEAYFKGKRG